MYVVHSPQAELFVRYLHIMVAVSKFHTQLVLFCVFFNFFPFIIDFFFFKQRCLFCKSFFFIYLKMHNCKKKKLPFEIHLLISTNEFYAARKWPDFSRHSNLSWASLEARDPFLCHTNRGAAQPSLWMCSCHHSLKETCSVKVTVLTLESKNC